MREVKFQAWDKWEKEMLPVAGINFTNGFMWINELIDDETPANTRYLDEVVLRQYTGLKDKNDAEIFEGDIIRFYRRDDYNEGEEREGVSEVVYSSQLTAFCYFYQVKSLVFEKGKSKVISALGGVYDQCGYIKIIGNIYENPDLLESETNE